jgi:hypothetical protein
MKTLILALMLSKSMSRFDGCIDFFTKNVCETKEPNTIVTNKNSDKIAEIFSTDTTQYNIK